jgi:hypothetical protein
VELNEWASVYFMVVGRIDCQAALDWLSSLDIEVSKVRLGARQTRDRFIA